MRAVVRAGGVCAGASTRFVSGLTLLAGAGAAATGSLAVGTGTGVAGMAGVVTTLAGAGVSWGGGLLSPHHKAVNSARMAAISQGQ